MIIANKEFKMGHTHIMGILNITPDSFSDGGEYLNPDNALRRAEQMIKEGADIIDIGGESTRPGYTPITESEETARILPIVKAIKKEFDIPVSVDTYKSAVADAVLSCGADLINDIWGLKKDPKMADTISRYSAGVCIMHNRENTDYTDLSDDVTADLKESIAIAKAAGITDDKIIIDPGIGFAKDYRQNLELINKLDKLTLLGYPVLLGASRKSVIGITLDEPQDKRLYGTLATTAVACERGAMFVRVHDIKENFELIKMMEAIKNAIG